MTVTIQCQGCDVLHELENDPGCPICEIEQLNKALLIETDRVQDAWRKQWALEAEIEQLQARVAELEKDMAVGSECALVVAEIRRWLNGGATIRRKDGATDCLVRGVPAWQGNLHVSGTPWFTQEWVSAVTSKDASDIHDGDAAMEAKS